MGIHRWIYLIPALKLFAVSEAGTRIMNLWDSLADVQKETPAHTEQGAVCCGERKSENTAGEKWHLGWFLKGWQEDMWEAFQKPRCRGRSGLMSSSDAWEDTLRGEREDGGQFASWSSAWALDSGEELWFPPLANHTTLLWASFLTFSASLSLFVKWVVRKKKKIGS